MIFFTLGLFALGPLSRTSSCKSSADLFLPRGFTRNMPQPDVGIHAIEVYFPRFYVKQSDLELSDDCAGKYTKGLGQETLGVCAVEEDISSLALTVVSQLAQRINLDLKTIGFMEVGSETLIDKSKSTKSVLMELFESAGNFDVEGVDVKNACFGGTAALFHAINWLESSSWDGRLALVVAADVAVYGSKAARPTGGAGAVAILLGPDAPLVFDRGLRAHTVRHRYDFYKPDLSSEYPLVDGQLSMQCYQEALLSCYDIYKKKVSKQGLGNAVVIKHCNRDSGDSEFEVDYLCFHSPFVRLVRKAYGWLALKDVHCITKTCEKLEKHSALNGVIQSPHSTVRDNRDILCTNGNRVDENVIRDLMTLTGDESQRDVDILCMKATAKLFAEKVEPGLVFAKRVGNMYTASLYACLASLLLSVSEENLRGRRVLLYSYGSGMASAMFSLRVHPSRPLSKIVHSVATEDCMENPLFRRLLHDRTRLTVAQFEDLLTERKSFHNAVSFKPVHRPEGLFPGTYYLTKVDERYRRTYNHMPYR